MHKLSIYYFIHKYIWDIVAVFSFILIFSAFFARLFYPHVSVFYIPDSFNSDVFHVNLSQKIYLSEVLKSGHLPFITQDIANGFPLFGESQIGAISIFNLLFYRFLDPIIAFNLTYLLGFIFMSLFLYLLGKHLYQNRFLAYILAISYSFSGIVIMKLTHQGILQAVFLIPVILYFYIRGIGNFNMRNALIAGFFCGQQFLFGHFFVAIGTSINILIMFLYSYITNSKNRQSQFLYFGLFTLSTILISLPQLVQSYIFNENSARSAGANIGMFDLKYILTLLGPDFFGSLKDGSIFKNSRTFLSRIWESNLFIGYAPLLLLGISANIHKNLKKVPRIYMLLLLIFTLLMLGNYPLINYLGYLPVLAGFRAHTRFSIFTALYLIIIILYIAKYGFKFSNKLHERYIFSAIILVQIISSFYLFYTLHPIVERNKLLKLPVTARVLPPDSYYYSLNSAKEYHDIFYSEGYEATSKYIALHTSLYPYSNFIYNKKTCGLFLYSNFNPKLYQDIALQISLNLSNENEKTIRNTLKTKLGILGCTHIISSKPLSNSSKRVSDKSYITKLKEQIPTHALFASNVMAFDSDSLLKLIENNTYDLKSLHLYADTGIGAKSTNKFLGKVKQIEQSNTKHTFTVQSNKSSFFFLRILHYPGYHAYIDGKEAKILKANLLYMAITVPKGDHTIVFKYVPPYWHETVASMLFFYFILIVVLIFYKPNPNTNIE